MKKMKTMKNNDEMIKVDIFEVLLDENNTAPIYMSKEDGERIAFDQIAVIPYGDDLYCILKPITKVHGFSRDEAAVFQALRDEEGEGYLHVVDDEMLACKIFEQYYELIEQEMKENE